MPMYTANCASCEIRVKCNSHEININFTQGRIASIKNHKLNFCFVIYSLVCFITRASVLDILKINKNKIA